MQPTHGDSRVDGTSRGFVCGDLRPHRPRPRSAAVLLVVRPAGTVGGVVGGYLLLNLLAAAVNSIPFVKLDGYWIVAAALDRPNLRAEALEEAGSIVRRRKLPKHPALAAFGVASWCTGGLLIASAMTYIATSLSRRGPSAGSLSLSIGASVLVALVQRVSEKRRQACGTAAAKSAQMATH